MTFQTLSGATLAALFLASTAATASTLTITFGDEDCFSTDFTGCTDGDTVDTAAIMGNALDGITDNFGFIGTSSFDFQLSLAADQQITSAIFTAQVVGLDTVDEATPPFGDDIRGTRVTLDGTDVFNYNPDPGPGGAFPLNEVDIITFAIANDALNINGSNVISIIPEEAFEQFGVFEDYAIDFASLVIDFETVTTPPGGGGGGMPSVPLPASMGFSLLGLGALAGMRRFRAKR